jgi:FkbM family methyltransferase
MSQTSPTTAPRRILCVSIPRSGHHYLVSILQHALGNDCFYCEYYTPVECCRTVPCTRGGGARFAIQKNHDLDLTVPADLPGLIYVIQHRNPVMAVLSDRDYLARLEGRDVADDAHEFRVWLGRKAAHFRRFWDKWLARRDGRRVVIDYADLAQHPAAAAQRVLAAAGIALEAGRLEEAVETVSGFVADFPKPAHQLAFEARVMTRSRYFDPELMSAYESMLLDTIDGLEPTGVLPHVETSGHPIRLVYEAALRSAAGAASEASTLLRQAAAADPDNPFILEALSHACQQADDAAGAVAAAADALRLRPKHTILLRVLSDAHAARARTDLDEAIALARTLVEVSPHDAGHLIHLAALLAKRQEIPEAAAMAVRAMAEAPADANVWRECSEILSMAGDLSGALDAVRHAVTRMPGQAEFHHHLGNLLARRGDVDDAIRSHQHALGIAPSEANWRAALIAELVAAGRRQEAERVIDEGLRLRSGDERLAEMCGRPALPPALEPAGSSRGGIGLSPNGLIAEGTLSVRESAATQPLVDDSRNKPTREDVVSAYRLLLGREPEDEQAIASHLSASDRTTLLRGFVESDEFRSRVKAVRQPPPELHGVVTGPLADFAPASWPAPGPDQWVDALGVRTRCSFQTVFERCGGQILRQPHDSPLEWQALLEALAAARDRFCMIELGAGYGPWLARAGVAWRRRYPGNELVLVGLEAEPEHFRYLGQHLADNDVPDQCLRLLHAAVSEEDGVAEFEVAQRPAADWGTRLIGGTQPSGLPRLGDAPRISVQTISLNTLAAHLGPIDLLHVDIQGSEVPVLGAARRLLRDQVRWLVVGTHGRDIEGQMIDLLVPLGFRLRNEHACRYRLDGAKPVLVADGTQVWSNRALVASQ